MATVTLLDDFRKYTVMDVDANDEKVTLEHLPFHDMTSNQAIVLGEIQKPGHQHLVDESAKAALVMALAEGITDEKTIASLAVDWMTIKLGLRVIPHLHPKGYVHAQTLPSQAYSTPNTVTHARLLVKLYALSGVPESRVCIKIPSTLQGLRACAELEKTGVKTLATTVFCVEQALAAAEDAKCLYVAPYVNPLAVHFVEGRHVVYEDPLSEMYGVKVTGEIQREFRRRGLGGTKVLAASLVTAAEVISLSGIDHATLSPAVLKLLATTPLDDRYTALRDRAIQFYDPTKQADVVLEGKHFPLADPAKDFTEALEKTEVKALMDDALARFGDAEEKLFQMGLEAVKRLKK